VKFELTGKVIVKEFLLFIVSTMEAVNLKETTLLTVIVVVEVIANEVIVFGTSPVIVVVHVSIWY
jgi:hypothetical protein